MRGPSDSFMALTFGEVNEGRGAQMQEVPTGKQTASDSVTEQVGNRDQAAQARGGEGGGDRGQQCFTCNFSKTFFLGLSSSSGWPFS
jgi:hypothetical protein